MSNNEQSASTNPFVQAVRGRGIGKVGSSTEQKKDRATPERKKVVESTMEAMIAGDHSDSREASKAGSAGALDGGRMEAVVDLLFGNHLEEINTNMRALEKQFAERVNKAEEEMRVRIEALDRLAKEQIDTLERSIESERQTRGDADSKLDERVGKEVRRIDSELEEMAAKFAKNHEAAQKEIDDRLIRATDETDQLRRSTEREITEMKKSLSTRSELGGMFTELGKRLGVNADNDWG